MINNTEIKGGQRTKGILKHGTNEKPLISIITVVLNGEKYLEKTILSISKQTYKNVEHIIIDGGSSDRTLDIIRKYEDLIDIWISEKDKGLYNAMNKGIALSNGDFIGFVGSDDYLYHNTLEKLAHASKQREIDYTVGPVDILSKNGQLLEKINVLSNFLFKNKFIFDMATHHLSFYVNRNMINRVGGFDENFSTRSDYDMTISIMSLSKRFYYFNESVGAFRLGGVSGTYKSYLENFYILRKHKISIIKSILNILPSLFKLFIINNFPKSFINFLRKNFSSGRFEKYN